MTDRNFIPVASDVSTKVVSEGKCSRFANLLQKKQTDTEKDIPEKSLAWVKPLGLSHLDEIDFQQTCLLIDQRIEEITRKFPISKRNSLFKIRFGLGLEELRALPIKKIVKILKIPVSQLPNSQSIQNLDYYGRFSKL